jgi:hypothetical protein
MNDRRGARQAGLLIVVFVAALGLLAGTWSLLAKSPAPSASGSSTGPSPAVPASASGDGSPFPSAGPAADPTATVVLLGAGDIADCTLAGAGETADLLSRQPGWIFTAGDSAYENGSAADYAACYGPTWGRLKDRTILTATGNHDWQTPGAAGYLGYFGRTAAPDGVTWYSLDLGAWHVIVLDSSCAMVGGCDAASPQGRWLARDLAASAARCTLAIWHHPLYSSGEHGNDPDVRPFWEQLHAANAELIVNGHDHDYERFAPMDPNGSVERPGGLRELVAGTGGGELRSFHGLAQNSEFRQAGSWGVLRLTLHPANYEWEFLPVGTDIADSGSTPCH